MGYDVNARLARSTERRQQRDQRVRQARRRHRDARRTVLLQDDQPGACGHPASSCRASTSTGPIPATSLTCSRAARSSGRAGIASRAARRSASPARSAASAAAWNSPPSWPAPSAGASYDFVERLWAVRRLGDLIDQIDMHGQNRELVDELVRSARSTASSRRTRRSWPTNGSSSTHMRANTAHDRLETCVSSTSERSVRRQAERRQASFDESHTSTGAECPRLSPALAATATVRVGAVGRPVPLVSKRGTCRGSHG